MHITTFTGKYVNPTNLKPEDVTLTDIIQSLSLMTRFNGMLPISFSILQHSCHCYYLAKAQKLDKRLLLASAIHDFCESLAPAGDILGPNKSSFAIYSEKNKRIMTLRDFESDLMETIIEGLGISNKVSIQDCNNAVIKKIDKEACNSESHHLRGFKIWDNIPIVKNEGNFKFFKRKPEEVREEFLQIYGELTS